MPNMIPKNGTGRAMKAARIAIARADRLPDNKSAAATSATMPDNIFQTMMQTYRGENQPLRRTDWPHEKAARQT